MSFSGSVFQPARDVEEIEEIFAVDEEKDFVFEAQYDKNALLAKKNEILCKFQAFPHLFEAANRLSRERFLLRCDKQIKRLELKGQMWVTRKANCLKLKKYDDALEAIEEHLKVNVFFHNPNNNFLGPRRKQTAQAQTVRRDASTKKIEAITPEESEARFWSGRWGRWLIVRV